MTALTRKSAGSGVGIEVGLAGADDVGFLELVLREVVGRAAGVDEDGEGREAVDVAVIRLERLEHGRGEIDAAADWLGEDHVGGEGAEAVGGVEEVAEAAAEASAARLRRWARRGRRRDVCPRVRRPGR